jgi:hypothetical protein
VPVLSAVALLLVTAWLTARAGLPESRPQKPEPTPPAFAPGQTEQSNGATGPFTIGLLRRDSVVTPFATFDGKAWTSPWPVGLQSLSVPLSLDAVPGKWWGKAGALAEMTLWAGGERRGSVRLERPATVRIMCSARVGLRSNYVSPLPAPPPIERSYPKDGLVVSGSTVVEPIMVVPKSSPEWQASELLLPKPFDVAENTAAQSFTDWKHPIKRAQRRQMPVELEALYKAPMDVPGWVAYRFHAVRRYAPQPADGNCGLLSSAVGWIAAGPNGKHWTQLAVRVTYCDRMDDVLTLPFGLIRAAGRSYWIYQLSGYDREGYVIARPTPKGIESNVEYPAGFCPR